MNCAKILTAILSVFPVMAMADVPASNPATAPAAAPAPARVKVAYLGVAVSGLDAATAKQFNLAAGSGLRVFFVVPKSPADLAGLKTNDVLVKLDDQLLINPPQFTVLVRTSPPGRRIALKIIRGTEEMTLAAMLGQKEILGAAEAVEVRPKPGGMRPNSYEATIGNEQYLLKYVIEGGRKSLTVTDVKTGGVVFSGPANTKEEADKVPQDALPLFQKLEKDRNLVPPAAKVIPIQVLYRDGKYNMTLRVENGQKFLVVKDKAGATLYDGLAQSPQQVQGLAAEIQNILKIMEKSLQSVSALGATRPADK